MQNTGESVQDIVTKRAAKAYAAGFVTDIESDTDEPGLSEETIAKISGRKKEPQWLLEWRLKAYRAGMGARSLSARRLPGYQLLLRTQVHEGPSEVSGRGGPQAA